MSFTQNTNNQTKFFTGNSAISWSDMRTNFGGPSGQIKFSDYYRNASTTETSPVVPNATENASINTSGVLSAETFRNSIDEYIVILNSGTSEGQTDVDQLGWNSNLGLNVPKTFRVEGTAFSTNNSSSASASALHFNAAARNFTIRIAGVVYGARGTGGSANCGSGSRGGDAIFLNNNSSNSNASGRATVQLAGNSNARLWAGGGGGGAGNKGNNGPTLNCSYTSANTITVYSGGSTNPNRGCNHGYCPNNSNSGGAGGYLYAQPCFGQGSHRGRCRRRQDRGQTCVNVYKRTCYYSHSYNQGGGTAGNGGNGGNGGGITNTGNLVNANFGNSGNNGNSNSCPGGGTSTGNKGNRGGKGGTFGAKGTKSCGNAGPAGRAVYKSNGNSYSVNGQSSNKLKGSI